MTPDLQAKLRELPPGRFVGLAVTASLDSPCRSKRGVVIFSVDTLMAHGHNFKPQGFECDGSELCKSSCRAEAVHAEQMAIMMAGRNGTFGADLLHVKTVDGELVPSGGPSCVECSKLSLVAGIAGVWLYHVDGWRRYEIGEFHRLSLAAYDLALQEPSPLQEEAVEQFRMDELEAVMLSVDKWLVGADLLGNPATRAARAREVALQTIEDLVTPSEREQALEAQLASAHALQREPAWQPMETAPKNGQHFLAATKFLGIPCVEAIWWDNGWKGASGEQRFDAWMPLPAPPVVGRSPLTP